TGTVRDVPRSGRLRTTSGQEDRYLELNDLCSGKETRFTRPAHTCPAKIVQRTCALKQSAVADCVVQERVAFLPTEC
ncbi:hypothetical protein MAR_020664, partial [Mya arenaria]